MQNNVEMGASMLIPVPKPLGGAIIVGETLIVYHNGTSFKAIQIPPVSLTVTQESFSSHRYLLPVGAKLRAIAWNVHCTLCSDLSTFIARLCACCYPHSLEYRSGDTRFLWSYSTCECKE